ncbi:MAG: tetratricopeptide repeat protein [Limisphaerales bacterium]
MNKEAQQPALPPVGDTARRNWLLGVLLVALTIMAYQPAWHAGTIWDDDDYITPPKLRSLNGLASIWTQPGATHQYYPLVHTIFWVEHRLWGDATAGYHWVNILLHAGSALLLARILRQLRIPGAWLAAALFALHPVEVESVAWITELKNTLSGLFYLSAVLVYLGFDRKRSWESYALALGLFILGLLCKTVIATLPAALLVVFWWQRGTLSWKRDVLPLLPFFITGLGAGLFTAWMERKFVGATGAEFDFSLLERFLIAGRDIWFYLGKLCWPVDLAFIYHRWNVSQGVWWQYLFPAAALLLLGLLLWRRWRGPLAGLLFFVGTLFPALGFFNVFPFRYSFVADHFQYLASLGPLTLAAAGISTLPGLFRKPKPFLVPVLCAVLALVLGTLTWRQCRMYANEETLWRTTLRLNPDCWMADCNLGGGLVGSGRLDEGIPLLQHGLQLNPRDFKAHYDLAFALLQKGKVDEAIAHSQKALDLNPRYAEPHLVLGDCFFRQERMDQAASQYQEALKMGLDSAEVYQRFGKCLVRLGWVSEAIARFQSALQINPDLATVHLDLGNALLQEGKMNEAMTQFQRALELKPDLAEARGTLGSILARLGRTDEAIVQFQTAMQLDPDSAQAHLNLGNALLQEGKVDEAITHYEKALQLNPNYGKAYSNLANALLQQGRVAEAIARLQQALKVETTDPSIQNNLAWLLATCPDASLRNGAKALELARQANESAGGKNPFFLHTLAAAFAETRQFAEAVQCAQKAIELAQAAGRHDLAERLNSELQYYEAGRPLHQP